MILDLRINGFDLLPDFLGYILVALGCGGLTAASNGFTIAGIFGWLLVPLSLGAGVLHGEAATALGVIATIADCTMMWFLLGGVMELAKARRHSVLCERASNRRIAYVVMMCLMIPVGTLAQNSPDAAKAIAVIMVIGILAVLILILHLILRAKHELTDTPSPTLGEHDDM